MCGFVAESLETIKDNIDRVVGSCHPKIKNKIVKLIFDTGASIPLTPDKINLLNLKKHLQKPCSKPVTSIFFIEYAKKLESAAHFKADRIPY